MTNYVHFTIDCIVIVTVRALELLGQVYPFLLYYLLGFLTSATHGGL